MNLYFFISGILAFAAGAMHSFFGEKYFIPHLSKEGARTDLQTNRFYNRTLRSAWHLSTIASWSSAVLLLVFSMREFDHTTLIVVRVISNFYLLSGILSIFISHGRHLIWLIFFILALLTWLGTL